MQKWAIACLWVVAVLCPTFASAYCSQTNGRLITRFEDAVNANLDYLLCLHNEQVTTLNGHAEAIDSLSNYITAFEGKVSAAGVARSDGGTVPGQDVSLAILRDVASRYEAIEKENADLRKRVEALEAKQADKQAAN